MSKPYRQLPSLLYHWLTCYPAYLTGSAAEWYLTGAEDDTPRDFDVFVVRSDAFNQMLQSAPTGASIGRNSLGGVKLQMPSGTEIDVWPQSLSEFFSQAKRKGYSDVTAMTLDPKMVLTCE